MTLTELKARAFDLMRQIEVCQLQIRDANLQIREVNQEISRLEQEELNKKLSPVKNKTSE